MPAPDGQFEYVVNGSPAQQKTPSPRESDRAGHRIFTFRAAESPKACKICHLLAEPFKGVNGRLLSLQLPWSWLTTRLLHSLNHACEDPRLGRRAEDFRSGIARAPTAARCAQERSTAKPARRRKSPSARIPRSWFLLGASPDLRAQIEATPELHPREGVRQSPIAGAVLANADVDHVLGLLLLRELQPLRVYATDSIRRILTEDNSMFAMLQRIPAQVTLDQL